MVVMFRKIKRQLGSQSSGFRRAGITTRSEDRMRRSKFAYAAHNAPLLQKAHISASTRARFPVRLAERWQCSRSPLQSARR
jgi:hypothetical protein